VVGQEPVEPGQVRFGLGRELGAGLAGGVGLDRGMDQVAEIGGGITGRPGGLLDLADRLAGRQQPEVVEVADGVLRGDLGRPADQERLGHAAVEDGGHTRELAALPAVDPVAGGGGAGKG
jgi:hypothetical protein